MKRSGNIVYSNYVLVTAAKNEENYIENTIKAVVAQTVPPLKWIIVSDGSTDSTDQIVLRNAAEHDFITLIRKPDRANGTVDFTSKVHAIMMGHDKLKEVNYDFIGILDGDVTFDSYYYQNILSRFEENPKLGVAGGIVLDQQGDRSIRRSPNRSDFVSGCVQLFRRKCFEEIGGLYPIREGGEDTIAAVNAQMKGWTVEAFEEIKVYHHKRSADARGRFKEAFRLGRTSYALGCHPLFEIFKSIKSITTRPYLLFAMIRFFGCFLPYLKNQKRPVTKEFVQFLRRSQRDQLKRVFFVLC